MLGLSVCVGRESTHPPPSPYPKRQRNSATASRPRWGLYPRAARGWGAHLGARVGLCTGQGTSCPDLRVSYALRISYAAAGATTGLWLGLGAHPIGLSARNAHNSSLQKPEACPAPRRTAVQARPYHLRSARKRRVCRARQGDVGRHTGHGAGVGLAKRHERAAKAASTLGCAATHGSGASLLGRRATGTTPTRRPKSMFPTGTGRCVTHERSDRTTGAKSPERCADPRARAVGIFQGG